MMNTLITEELIQLFEHYPIRAQEESDDPLVVAKLFDAYGSASWYLTEYDKRDQLAFGYVVGLAYDEWGYISLEELSDVQHPILGVPRIERDLYFKQKPFSELGL
ncbi:MAG: DUF2958 domain-containing protein [Gammaproteobacteria bacterium]|jgi:hypothetical protein|nr:DUF2958 domain-containing protein [Gammaproteobacteria bacterium]MBT4130681.1 DUF2958 domain-containing protein [Candidatus Neomarinimicrobiota bacterium]MBT4328764.1 DUF2958 domain-containing protein [Gammaproteobacteria bacterium]